MVAKPVRSHANSWVWLRLFPAGERAPRVVDRAIWGAKRGAVMTLCAFLLGGCADLPLFHEPATFAGFATNPKESVDFVKETHPENTEFTSVGVEPGHPPDKPRDKDGVKQLQTELEAQRDTGHAILQKLSPEAANAQAQKSDGKAKLKEAAKKNPKEDAAAKEKGQVNADAPAVTPASQ